MITGRHVHVRRVLGVPQFWLVWLVLCLNVTAGVLAAGMVCHRLMRPVDDQYFMTDAELAAEKKLAHERELGAAGAGPASDRRTSLVTVLLAWAVVGIPLAIGIWLTLQKALILFK